MQFQFESLEAFMLMKGHGPYVWACYAITFSVIVGLIVSPLVQRQSFIRQQRKWLQLQKSSTQDR